MHPRGQTWCQPDSRSRRTRRGRRPGLPGGGLSRTCNRNSARQRTAGRETNTAVAHQLCVRLFTRRVARLRSDTCGAPRSDGPRRPPQRVGRSASRSTARPAGSRATTVDAAAATPMLAGVSIGNESSTALTASRGRPTHLVLVHLKLHKAIRTLLPGPVQNVGHVRGQLRLPDP